MIEVFKTNVHEACQAKVLSDLLGKHFPGCAINFDLEDCDKVLRIEHHGIVNSKIIGLLKNEGFVCEELE